MNMRKILGLLSCGAATFGVIGLIAAPSLAQEAGAGSSMPLSSAWNIASSGKAASSGELLFRVTPGNGEDPVEVTVFVLSGANETGVASSIRRALSAQLDAQRFDVQAGQGANVLVTSEGGRGNNQAAGFSVELLDSDVENVRVMVQNAAPVAPPTVPAQNEPADPDSPTPAAPSPADPQAPVTPLPNAPADRAPATPVPNAPTDAPPATPADRAPDGSPGARAPANSGSRGTATDSPPGNASGGAGAPASAPPPPPVPPGP
jgi:hypothetical protein